METRLRSLLAAIHGDGGQHTAEVGIERSCREAEEKYYRLLVEQEETRKYLERKRFEDASERLKTHLLETRVRYLQRDINLLKQRLDVLDHRTLEYSECNGMAVASSKDLMIYTYTPTASKELLLLLLGKPKE